MITVMIPKKEQKMSKKNNKDIEENIQNDNEESKEELVEEMSAEQKLEVELEEAQAEAQKYKDEYLRAYADFENSKKRLEKEKANAVLYANEAFAKDMLSVIDSIENAITSTEQIDTSDCSDAIDKFKEGLTLTLEQTLSVLKKHGVEEVAHEGVFDPNFHQVLMQIESDEHKKDEIVQVMQKGYKMKDRVIRPAMVGTAK